MAQVNAHQLWYDRPAKTWTEALPVGNGRTGAMCFGGLHPERLQINDGTAWSGSPVTPGTGELVDRASARTALSAARAAVARGDYAAATPELQKLQHRYSQ